MIRRPYFALVIVMLALAALACNLPFLGEDEQSPAVAPAASAPVAEIRVPVNGMTFAEGTTVVIQVVGTDTGAGVSRIDLLVDDLPAGSSNAPTVTGQAAYIANFNWVAQGVGAHSISANALRQDGTSSTPVVISVNVIAAPPTEVVQPTSPPQPTAVPQETEPQATEAPPTDEPQPTDTPTGPRATTTAGVNVRRGPSTLYPVVGSLLAGSELELIGRNQDNSWFQVTYGLSNGWIFGQLLTTSGDVNSLPIPNVPPPPPTATPIPTAAPLPTAAPAGPSVQYWSTASDGVTYSAGTVIRFYWEATGIKEIYWDNQAVTGSNAGGTEVTVNATKTFTLRVVYQDGSTQNFNITVNIG